MDYEQLYYDSQYEIRNLKKKIRTMEQELKIYKSLQKDKDVKNIIIEDLLKYLNKNPKIEKENKHGSKN